MTPRKMKRRGKNSSTGNPSSQSPPSSVSAFRRPLAHMAGLYRDSSETSLEKSLLRLPTATKPHTTTTSCSRKKAYFHHLEENGGEDLYEGERVVSRWEFDVRGIRAGLAWSGGVK